MIGCCRAVNPSVLNIRRPYPAPSLSRWSPTQRSFLRFCRTSSISDRQEQREQRRRPLECQLREGLGKLAKKGGGILTATTAAAAVDGGESGRMVSYVSATLYVVSGIVVAGMALLVAFQERLVYVPVLPGLSKSYSITPSRLRLLYEDVWLRSSDGIRLHAWFIKLYPDCRGPTILFFQENAGNIAHRLEMVRIMLQKLQCNVFMLSYRGYGASDGSPSQHGIIKDAQAALDHLMQRTDVDTSQIVVFGRSLGGAVGAVLSNNNPDKVSALILENTFTSILDMAGVLLPFLKWFIGGTGSKSLKILNGVVRSPWSTIDIISQVRQPILFLSGLQDEMVPPMHMKLLYAKAAARNKHCLFAEFPSGMHMDTWYTGGDQYWKTVQKFIKDFAVDKKQRDSSLTNSGSSSFTDSGTSSFTNSDADPW